VGGSGFLLLLTERGMECPRPGAFPSCSCGGVRWWGCEVAFRSVVGVLVRVCLWAGGHGGAQGVAVGLRALWLLSFRA